MDNFNGYMKPSLTVQISKELLQMVLHSAQRLHPKETIFLLRGNKTKKVIRVSELVVPPLATYGRGFANVPVHMLPMDFSIVGTVHSHPSGNLTPSYADLNHSFGVVIMIVSFPFADESNVAVYNHSGEKLTLEITKA